MDQMVAYSLLERPKRLFKTMVASGVRNTQRPWQRPWDYIEIKFGKLIFYKRKKKSSRSLLSGTKNKTSKKPVKLFYFLPIFMNFVFPHFSDFWGPLNLRGLLKKTQRLDALSGPLKTFLKYCPLSKGEHQDLAFLRYLYNFRAKKKYPHFILYFCYTTT